MGHSCGQFCSMDLRYAIFCVTGCSLLWLTFAAPYGPYDFEVSELGTCDNPGTDQIHFGTRISKISKGKYVYKSNFTLGVPWNNFFKIYADYQEWGNGGYRPRSMEHTMRNCEEVWQVASAIIIELMRSAGVDLKKCPVPAGNFTALSMEVKFPLNIPSMLYGKCRLMLHFFYKEVKVGCMVFSGELVPKKN